MLCQGGSWVCYEVSHQNPGNSGQPEKVLSYMTLALKGNIPENVEIFSDLEGHKINGRTIPKDIIVTSSIPDLVILDSSTHQKTVYLFELTVCFERLTIFSQPTRESTTDTPHSQQISRTDAIFARTFHSWWVLWDI